jgi:flagellar M-ring protein FliF
MAGFNSSAHNTPFGSLVDQCRMWWDGSTTATRVISIGLGILVVLCLGGAVMLATTPEMDDLFTNLDPRDAAAIAAKLDDEHEKYIMIDGETTIQVPSGDKDRLRMEMIRDGLPAKTGAVIGTDYLDKIGLGTTPDVQDQYIQLANEAELSQTISSMTEVSSAVVHISPGSDSPFADNESSPTASVVVGLKPGMTLSSDQVMGIANLVAKAVSGLDVKNIEVVDTNGNQLWDGEEETGPGGLASTRMMAERTFADDMRKQMQSYLDTVLGEHKALVSVRAELNYDQVHTLQTTYTKGAVLSSQDTDEQYKGSSGAPGAVPAGVNGNTTAAPQYTESASGSGKTGNYDNSVSLVNNDPDKTDTETQDAPGGIQRLAVAVLVDSSVTPDTVGKIQTYLQTLAGATPNDPSRVVTVQSVPFSNADATNQLALMKQMQSAERMQEFIKIGLVALVAIVILVIFLRSSKGFGTRMVTVQQLTDSGGQAPMGRLQGHESTDRLLDEPMSIEDLIGDMPMPGQAVPSAPRVKPIIPEIEEHMDVKLESVRDMVKNHPQSVALLMKGWISDESESNSH